MKKEDLKILALIPARGGSKRLPGKNIKDFCGKPLIAWTIEAALQSNYIDTVSVSTDCEEIAKVSKQHGATIPFIRPVEIAKDQTEIPKVIDHCLSYYREQKQEFTHILLLQPTCPLRSVEDINASIELLIERKATAIYSVCEVEHSPLWANTLDQDQSFDNFLPSDIAGVRSQGLPIYYRLNGSIYLVEVTSYQEKNSLFHHSNTFAQIMDRKNSIDIDEPIDFIIAQTLKDHL